MKKYSFIFVFEFISANRWQWSRPVLVALMLQLGACATIPSTGPAYLATPDAIPATYYDVNITTFDGKQLRATVFQPALKPGQDAPLIIHTHGFGVFRMSGPISLYGLGVLSGEAAKAAWKRGYWVISYDERGHGDSQGINRLMDPKHEVRDLSTVIDWARDNLKRITRSSDGRLIVGTIGESYGGGAMLLDSANDPRIRAMVPITTWNDIGFSLAPNGVPKSGWLTTLVLVDNLLNPGRSDPIINESYWKAREGIITPKMQDYLRVRSPKTYCEEGKISHADTLLIQGFRDVAFPINEAVANMKCLASTGSDVRLIGTQGGHLLPFTQWSWILPGYDVESEVHCGDQTLNLVNTAVDWFDAKLKQIPRKAEDIPHICLTESYDRGIKVNHITYGGRPFHFGNTRINSGFTGFFEEPLWPLERMLGWFLPADRNPEIPHNPHSAGYLRPAFTPLYVARSDMDMAGIPTFNGELTAPAEESDPMVYMGIAVKRASGRYYELLNDQVTPLRGTGAHQVDMMAISTHLKKGDIVGVWLFGYHNQYRFSHTGWFMKASIDGTIALPLLDAGSVSGPLTADNH